jgi:hypothetical protein
LALPVLKPLVQQERMGGSHPYLVLLQGEGKRVLLPVFLLVEQVELEAAEHRDLQVEKAGLVLKAAVEAVAAAVRQAMLVSEALEGMAEVIVVVAVRLELALLAVVAVAVAVAVTIITARKAAVLVYWDKEQAVLAVLAVLVVRVLLRGRLGVRGLQAPLVFMVAAAAAVGLVASLLDKVLWELFVSSTPEIHVHSHLLTQEICNETFYSN